jgi:hypothetical protein
MTIPLRKSAALAMAASFAAVGALFLFLPDAVLGFMNGLGGTFGFPPAPVQGVGFYLALAVGYMYIVTVLAVLMFRNPEDRTPGLLLAHAKGASAALSFGLFALHRPYFIFLANGLIDLLLCGLALALRRAAKKR